MWMKQAIFTYRVGMMTWEQRYKAGEVLKNNNGAKKTAVFLLVRQVAVTLHKN